MSKGLLLVLFLTVSNFYAKADSFDELLILYVDEEYEKCISKSEKYMDKRATRKEPLPYLYASMSYYEMSQLPEYEEEYPKAFKEAMKNAAKFVRKDRENEYINEHEWYLPELLRVAHESAMNYYLDDKSIMAVGMYTYVLMIDESDLAANVMMYVCYMKDDKRSKAYDAEKEILKMKKDFDPSDVTSEQKFFVEKAFKEYEAVVEEMFNEPQNYEEIKSLLSSVVKE